MLAADVASLWRLNQSTVLEPGVSAVQQLMTWRFGLQVAHTHTQRWQNEILWKYSSETSALQTLLP